MVGDGIVTFGVDPLPAAEARYLKFSTPIPLSGIGILSVTFIVSGTAFSPPALVLSPCAKAPFNEKFVSTPPI